MRDRTTLYRILRITGWYGFLIAIQTSVGWLNTQSLRMPLATNTARWTNWFARQDVAVLVVAAICFAVLVATWYLLVATTFSLVADISGDGRLRTIRDRFTVATIRSLTARTVGLGVVATMAIPASMAQASTNTMGDDLPVMRHRAAEPPSTVLTTGSPDTTSPATPAIVSLPASTAATSPPSISSPSTPPVVPQPAVWTIKAGDNLWVISQDVLSAKLGRLPTNIELIAYWRSLVDANQDALVHPDNPDLVYAGQTLVLPNS